MECTSRVACTYSGTGAASEGAWQGLHVVKFG